MIEPNELMIKYEYTEFFDVSTRLIEIDSS